mgnify:CR=1 FL=1
MRIGFNPEKESHNLEVINYHRVIVPVYIPNFEGYFAQAFEVFKLCIESLLLTIHTKTRITIYNNNCHPAVKNYIDEKYQKSIFIDQVFHSKENLGKINAILAASKGNLEPIITITDADVLFKHNWQKAVEEVFINFPHAGMVSPVPSSKAYSNYTAANWGYALTRGKLLFSKVVDSLALQRFDDSLGNPTKMYKQIHLEKYLIHKNTTNNGEAVMGCGHFVATLRREVFDKGTAEPAFVKIQKGVEGKFIDYPNEKLGYLRLATKANFAFHMGNTIENWMHEEFETLAVNSNKNSDTNFKSNSFKSKNVSIMALVLGKTIISLLRRKKLKKIIFNFLGLNSTIEY